MRTGNCCLNKWLRIVKFLVFKYIFPKKDEKMVEMDAFLQII